jgi:hypothetical protein
MIQVGFRPGHLNKKNGSSVSFLASQPDFCGPLHFSLAELFGVVYILFQNSGGVIQ